MIVPQNVPVNHHCGNIYITGFMQTNRDYVSGVTMLNVRIVDLLKRRLFYDTRLTI